MKEEHLIQQAAGNECNHLSERLRTKLERRLEDVYHSAARRLYFKNVGLTGCKNSPVSAIIDFNCDQGKAMTICNAIRTWYGMYPDDRAGVISRYMAYCELSDSVTSRTIRKRYHLAFSKFLVKEFAAILSDFEWSPLRSRQS